MNLNKELSVAIDAVKKVRQIILDVYYSNNLNIEIKSDNSPVTKADKIADEIIRNFLYSHFPNYAILTEESFDDKTRLENDFVWIVDPIDGTKDFVAHNDEFTVNIGLSYKHKPVLGVILIPVSNEIFYASKGKGAYYLNGENKTRIHVNNKKTNLTALISRFHSNETEQNMIKKHSDVIEQQRTVGATIKGCLIAKGEAEISYRFSSNTKEWDTCAMQAIVEEAGGFVLRFDGKPIFYNRDDVYNREGYVICNSKENFLL